MFLGLSGMFGGIGLIFGSWEMVRIAREPLDRIPVIDSWLVPGWCSGILRQGHCVFGGQLIELGLCG